METPFFGGTYESKSSNVADDRCINLYPELIETKEGKRIGAFYSTPGQQYQATIIQSSGDVVGPVRGMHTITRQNVQVIVSGNRVVTRTMNGAQTLIGHLNTSSGPVSIIDNGTQFLVVDGYQGWCWNGASWVLTPLVQPVVAVYQDGFGLANSYNTQQFYQSNLNDLSTWDPLNYSSADADPSPIIGMASLFRQIWIFKTTSTEIWNNAGLNGFAFQRMQGAFIEKGCVAPYSVSDCGGERVLWLGQDARGAVSVFINNGYSAQRISTHAIDYQLLNYINASQAGVTDAIAFSYNQAGHTFYVLTFPSGNATWVYDFTTKLWHERGQFLNGKYGRWNPSGYSYFNSLHYVGSGTIPAIAALNIDYPSDDLNGSPGSVQGAKRWMRRWRATSQPVNAPTRFESVKIDMETGIKTPVYAGSNMILKWSDDGGHNFANPHIQSMGNIGQTSQRVIFRRIGSTRRNSGLDRILEISSESNVQVALIGASIGDG